MRYGLLVLCLLACGCNDYQPSRKPAYTSQVGDTLVTFDNFDTAQYFAWSCGVMSMMDLETVEKYRTLYEGIYTTTDNKLKNFAVEQLQRQLKERVKRPEPSQPAEATAMLPMLIIPLPPTDFFDSNPRS